MPYPVSRASTRKPLTPEPACAGWLERSETHQWVAAHRMDFGYRLFPSYDGAAALVEKVSLQGLTNDQLIATQRHLKIRRPFPLESQLVKCREQKTSKNGALEAFGGAPAGVMPAHPSRGQRPHPPAFLPCSSSASLECRCYSSGFQCKPSATPRHPPLQHGLAVGREIDGPPHPGGSPSQREG